MKRYNPKEIEPKWRKVWKEAGLDKTPEKPGKDKFYCLVMFPYPSGNLHVGHWYNFGPADTVARFHRMTGKKVMHPIGYDSFGLPAENAAIKHNIPPAQWTQSNMKSMTKQLQNIGAMYDYDKMIATSDPDYYRWTQWLFLKLYENGLAYRKEAPVNWCPSCQTVLANEQVVGHDNHCERCEHIVEQKMLKQWYFKITDYTERLLSDAEGLDWPERVQTMQRNWIGQSIGAEIDFGIEGHDDGLKVFTTRPDTLFGATYMVLAPEHPIVEQIATKSQLRQVKQYIKETEGKTELDRKQDEKEKTGVFTGAHAINPVNNEKIPIWIADYVLMNYGTGAIMAVPSNDERDWEFAKKFDLGVVEVVKDHEKQDPREFGIEGQMINSGKYDGMQSEQAREEILKDLESDGNATEKVNYKLRDWLISRQRYWGAPIPIVYCDNCGEVPVPLDDLPVKLPEDVEFKPTGKSPLSELDGFVNTACPKCGGKAKRETDTMDTFVDSSWYYLRYPNTKYEEGPFDPEAVAQWNQVDHYIGGIEHAILHLLYSRFITKVLHDYADLPFEEPFKKLTNQGIILGPDGLKMSKSKGNVVDPDKQVASYGTDSLRLYLMFMGPYEQGGPYNMTGITGTRRFIDRVWTLVDEFVDSEAGEGKDLSDVDLLTSTHKTIKKVTGDLQRISFNTAISALMQQVNRLNAVKSENGYSHRVQWQEALDALVLLLAPMAPHVAEEMWHMLGHDESVHIQSWPVWDDELVKEELVTIVVQVNGKVRANIEMLAGVSNEDMVKQAQKDEKIQKYLKDGEVIKTITVPEKLVNFVVK